MNDQNQLNGDIGGPPPLGQPGKETGPPNIEGFDDGIDAYTFTIDAGLSMDALILTDYIPTPGNTTTGFNLWDGANGSAGTFLGSCGCGVGDIGTDLLTLFGTGPLAPGDYTMDIREFTNQDNVYGLDHQVPALPVTLQSITVD